MIHTLISIALIFIGFFVAETYNSFRGRKEKGTEILFTFIGIVLTKTDLQRLLLAILAGITLLLAHPDIKELINFDLNLRITYFVIGFAPSLIVGAVQKKINKKLDK